MHKPPISRPTRTIAVTVSVLATLFSAACSSSGGSKPAASSGSSSDSSAPTSSAGTSSAAPGGSGSAGAAATVEKYRQVPTTSASISPIANIAAMKGKTVEYMPIALQVPFFQAAIKGLTESLGKAGAKLETCDAAANPSSATACLNQALKQKVAAVVVDAVPEAISASGFAALKAAKIPVITVNGDDVTATATNASVGGGAGQVASKVVANWIINDSKGAADVLLLEIVDSSTSVKYVEQGALPEFKAACPACKVKVVKTTTGQLQNVPSLIGSSLVQDPKLGYVYSEFDADVSAVVQGLQTNTAGSKIKVVGTTGVLTSLQLIATGQHQVADVGFDGTEEGWQAADQAIRLALKLPGRNGVNPAIRIFDATNIKSLSLNAANAASGAFYGPGTYKTAFLTAWGLK